jgi:hypothetical protein
MHYQSKKSSLLLVPAMASLLLLALSTAASAEKSKHRNAVSEQDNSISADDAQQDNRQQQRGESIRSEQPMEKQPAAQIVQKPHQLPEHASQVELVRRHSEGQQFRQREQEAPQRASIAERIAAGESLAMRRNSADNARQNRQDQNEREDNNDRDNRNENNDRDNNGSRGNAIARKPYPQPDQRQWQEQQQRQANEYRHHLDGQQPTALRIVQNLRHQNRNEQYRSQQRYYDRMNDQRRYYDNNRNDDYYRGSYQYSPVIYRYNRGGSYYYANRYQADLMRQAINYGYEEGYYAGRADRMDRWSFNYRDAYAYQDANYGYGGYYVDRGTYNYYFRQGFSRGYDDGYYSRDRYGRHYNNNYSLNDSVFRLILNFSNWR